MNLNTVKNVAGLTEQENEMFLDLVLTWQRKLTRNKVKTAYYEGKNTLKNLGISIPKQLENIEAVVCWPEKAVDALSARSRFDGFTFSTDIETGINEIVRDNNLRLMYSQSVASELTNSCAFVTVSRGGKGEPPVMVGFHSAETSSALWSFRRKRIKCGLTIVETAQVGRSARHEPIWVNMYTDDAVIEIHKVNDNWVSTRLPHVMGRPLMEPMVYRPSLSKPFGKSRISRAVMSITDNAVRECLRSELGAEFYTTPQKYLLGASDDDFDKPKWEAYIGSIFTASRDENGDLPVFGQLAQASMQPHTEYMRELAAQFAGATSVPISSLGVIHDNPASAEAIYAAKEDLIIEAESLNETNGISLRNIGLMALAISQNKKMEDLTDEEKSIIPVFKNPAMPSVVSQSDAIVKQVSAMPWIGETEVALEELGYDESQRIRMMSDKTKAQSKATLNALFGANNDTATTT